MDLVVPKYSNTAVSLKPKHKIASKKSALSVINGEINTRKRNLKSLNINCKSQKQDNVPINPYLCGAQKFQIFEDVNVECKTQNDENHLPSNAVASVNSDSSPEFIAVSPEVFRDSHFLYTKKKKEKLSSDLVWCTPYRQNIYDYFKEIEVKIRPNPNYMDKQSDITMKMRSVLVDWFIEVGEEYKLQAETLHRAVLYVDRFLSHMSVLRGKLQLVGTASMFLASKYEEIYPPELSEFVFITDNTYTKKQVLRMETLILKVLNFDISVPTAYTFQQLYCSMCNASESLMQLSQYICELSLLDGEKFLKFPPSIVAAGSVALANYTLGLDMWDDNIAELSGYQLSELMYVILCLYTKYSEISSCPQQAIREKYKATKYGCVATIQHPEKLIFPKSSKEICYI